MAALTAFPAATWAAVADLEPPAESKAPATPEWPDSPAGRFGRAWLAAFNAGEPAMRRCLAEHLSAASLAERSLEARLATYRELRESLGRLALAEVVTAEAEAVTVTFSDRETQRHEFTFTVEAEPPHRIVAIRGRVTQRGGHFPH